MEPFQVATDEPVKAGDVYTFSNGATYSGQIRNGKMHGKGTYTDPSGSKYSGQWADGTMHGVGTCTSADGEEYRGEYYQGVPHGKGTYTFKNGNVYEGQYSQGKIHGLGVIKFPDNRRFEGEFRDNKKNGQGRYDGSNGIYDGAYVDGKKEGFGTFEWIDGSSYEGQWKADFMHGRGKKREKDGRMYDVVYEMGKVSSATPIQPVSTNSLPRSQNQADRPFSHTSLPPSLGSSLAGGGGSSRSPGTPASSFSRTVARTQRQREREEDAEYNENMQIIEREEDEEGPVGWLKKGWRDVENAVGCGGVREKIHKKGREMCGGAWDVVEANDCGGGART